MSGHNVNDEENDDVDVVEDNDVDDDDDDDNDDDGGIMMMMQGDSGGPLVSCGADGNCGTTPGQNYELIGAVIVIIVRIIVTVKMIFVM